MAAKKRAKSTKKSTGKKQRTVRPGGKAPAVAKKKPVKNAKKSIAKKGVPKKRKSASAPVEKPLIAMATPEPTGSCRYADSFGQIQCESPVTKGYCDSKQGVWVQDGRC
jgi:hypothetical protein